MSRLYTEDEAKELVWEAYKMNEFFLIHRKEKEARPEFEKWWTELLNKNKTKTKK